MFGCQSDQIFNEISDKYTPIANGTKYVIRHNQSCDFDFFGTKNRTSTRFVPKTHTYRTLLFFVLASWNKRKRYWSITTCKRKVFISFSEFRVSVGEEKEGENLLNLFLRSHLAPISLSQYSENVLRQCVACFIDNFRVYEAFYNKKYFIAWGFGLHSSRYRAQSHCNIRHHGNARSHVQISQIFACNHWLLFSPLALGNLQWPCERQIRPATDDLSSFHFCFSSQFCTNWADSNLSYVMQNRRRFLV